MTLKGSGIAPEPRVLGLQRQLLTGVSATLAHSVAMELLPVTAQATQWGLCSRSSLRMLQLRQGKWCTFQLHCVGRMLWV